jgi:hypothetical protein
MARRVKLSTSTILLSIFVPAYLSFAATPFTDEAAFIGAAGGPVSTLDFELLMPGLDLSGLSVAVGSTFITFPIDVDDVAGNPGDKLNLMVVEDLGDNPTRSPIQSLGTNDIGNHDLLISGTEIPLSFTTAVYGIGFSIVSPEPPGTFLLDHEVELVVPGHATAALELVDGLLLGNFGGHDYYEYFIGVISATPILDATLSYDGATPDGSFLFNVDDILVVPEPHTNVLLLSGATLLLVLARGRSGRTHLKSGVDDCIRHRNQDRRHYCGQEEPEA